MSEGASPHGKPWCKPGGKPCRGIVGHFSSTGFDGVVHTAAFLGGNEMASAVVCGEDAVGF
jgi:hypothetical protein